MHPLRILRISRPRFWIYELGPYALGALGAIQIHTTLFSLESFLFAIFFLFPANLYIYGINDIYDYETDALNPKKTEYEALVLPHERKKLFAWISLSTIPFFLFSVFTPKGAFISFLAFLFFAGFYSAPPIRAKAKPFLDSLFSAGHYVATAAFSYYLFGGSGFPLFPLLAGLMWSIAMHAYSAVPDIEADRGAGLSTIATVLEKKKTIILCALLYLGSGIFVFPYIGSISIILSTLYMFLMALSLRTRTHEELHKLYTYFPLLNTVSGMIIFFAMLLTLFPIL